MEKNLVRAKFTIDDLLEELRIKDVFQLEEVEFAILETNGKVSVLKKSSKTEPTKSELDLPSQYQGLSANLIIDGKIMRGNLAVIGKNETWLTEELQKQSIRSLKDVLLAYYDSRNVLHVDLKNNSEKPYKVL